MQSQRAGTMKQRAAAIAQIEASRHRPPTKERMIARLRAIWAERDRNYGQTPWFELECEVCHTVFKTPRDPKQHHGIVRCAPCAHEIRAEQKRAYDRTHRAQKKAREKASGVYQRVQRKARLGKRRAQEEAIKARKQMTLQFGQVLPGNLLVMPLVLPRKLGATRIVAAPATQVRAPRPRAPREAAVVWSAETAAD